MGSLRTSYWRDFSLDEIKIDGESISENPLKLTLEEEVEGASTGSIDFHDSYVLSRILCLEAEKKIIDDSFQFVDGCEFGSGPRGWFYNYFIDKKINWKQFDINPQAIEANRKYTKKHFWRSPNIQLGNMYQMPLLDNSERLVLGFNSWDSLLYPEISVMELNRVILPGGWFIHYQDIQPASRIYAIKESRKRQAAGLNPDVPCGFHVQTTNHPYFPGVFIKEEFITEIDSLEYGKVRTARYMNLHLEQLLREIGFEIMTNKEETAEVLTKKYGTLNLLRKHGYPREIPYNSFECAHGKLDWEYDSHLNNSYFYQKASMDILIARKI
jgi:hypothetical protein